MKKIVFVSLLLILQLRLLAENCKGETANGQRQGHWICYYDDNATLQQEGDYINGLKEGTWKFYHSNGKLALEGTYVKDVEKGKWAVYDENGAKIDEIDYGQ